MGTRSSAAFLRRPRAGADTSLSDRGCSAAPGCLSGPSRDDGRGPGLIPLRAADAAGIAAAVQALETGHLVLHPTETVASLSGDPHRPDTVAAARRVKGYEGPRPFLCLVPGAPAARALAAEWPAAAELLASAFWPGPLTLVVRAAGGAPEAVMEDGTLAVRPAVDPVSRSLVDAWRGPLFSTSANRRGEPASATIEEAAVSLATAPGAEAIALGLAPRRVPGGDSPSSDARPSSIVDVTARPRLVRPGAIAIERLREVVPDLVEGP